MSKRPIDRLSQAMIENNNKKTKEAITLEAASYKENSESERINNLLYGSIGEQRQTFAAYNKFLVETKEVLISECLYKVLDESVDGTKRTEDLNKVKHAICLGFVKEQGANNLLNTFKTASNLLSEFSCIVNSTYQRILETVDKTKATSFCINSDIKLDFYEDLAKIDTKDVSDCIRSKVIDAVNDFIHSNRIAKIKIQDTLDSAKEKIAKTSNAAVKEGCELRTRREVLDIKAQNNNVFGSMVNNFAESAFLNEAIRENYMTPANRIDIDKVVESCEIMYTFLETVNTARVMKVTEEYVKEAIDACKA